MPGAACAIHDRPRLAAGCFRSVPWSCLDRRAAGTAEGWEGPTFAVAVTCPFLPQAPHILSQDKRVGLALKTDLHSNLERKHLSEQGAVSAGRFSVNSSRSRSDADRAFSPTQTLPARQEKRGSEGCSEGQQGRPGAQHSPGQGSHHSAARETPPLPAWAAPGSGDGRQDCGKS